MGEHGLGMHGIMKDLEERRKMEIRGLESCSKQLSDFVVTENFTVDEVIANSHSTSFTPASEMRFGSLPPSYDCGFTSRLILKVTPDNLEVPIRTLIFDGISIVGAGDYISAKIPRYEEIRIPRNIPHVDEVFYLDRPFNPEESSIELAIYSTDKSDLRRTERAVDYGRFVKG